MRKTFAAAGLIAVLAAGYVLFFYHGNSSAKIETAPMAVPVKYVAAEGKVESVPGYEVEVGSEMDGRIVELYKKEGDQIIKGELIARIENSDIRAKIDEAEAEVALTKAKLREVAAGARTEEISKSRAALEGAVADMETARKELDRYDKLFSSGAVSRSNLEEKERIFRVSAARVRESEEQERLLVKGPRAETLRYNEDAVRRAEATAGYYRKLLEKTYISSPISGKVIRRYLHRGEMINRDTQPFVITVADLDRIRINAEADETDVGKIHIGDPAEIVSYAYPDRTFKGRVSEISDYAGTRKVTPNNPAKNRDMKVVQVKISLDEKTPLRLGMTVDVRVMPKAL
ncbi:MAG: HlyD family secretion protein [Nitrospirae bacterium]|nr:MAG: HlyD family secretion protein [Nitrospirota bacterium]